MHPPATIQYPPPTSPHFNALLPLRDGVQMHVHDQYREAQNSAKQKSKRKAHHSQKGPLPQWTPQSTQGFTERSPPSHISMHHNPPSPHNCMHNNSMQHHQPYHNSAHHSPFEHNSVDPPPHGDVRACHVMSVVVREDKP